MPFGGSRQYVLDDLIPAPWPWVPVILSNPSCGVPPPPPPGGPVPPPLPAAGGAYSQSVTITSGSVAIEGMMIYCSTSGASQSSACASVLFSHDAPGTFQYTLYAGLGTICGSGGYTSQMGGNSASVPNPPADTVVMNVT
jgi:hypothetical protein